MDLIHDTFGRRRRAWLQSAALAAAGLLAGCAGAPRTGAQPQGVEEAASPPSGTSGLDHAQAREVALQAMALIGTPYRFGGNTPEGGFDCSGLIVHVFARAAGLSLPRTVRELANWGLAVAPPSARPGDLVVFADARQASHAGIDVGQGRFVHAPSTGGTVRLSRWDEGYWSLRLRSVRRPA